MKSKELVEHAYDFYASVNCYLKGFWNQKLTQSEYDRVNRQYGYANDKYGNQKYVGTDCNASDCICFVKCLLAGGTPKRRLSYQEMKANPLGDCTTEQFYNALYDCVSATDTIPEGYGIASKGHAGITLGNGLWMDCNWDGRTQNGLAIHSTNPVLEGYRVGKIPGVTYESEQPVINTEKEVLENFCNWLIAQYINR